MKQIAQLLIMLLLVALHGLGYAGEHDPKPEFKSNFMYGTNDGASPDAKKLMTWMDKVSAEVKTFIKSIIGVNTFNAIGDSFNHFMEAIKNFFTQPWGKRMEWKAS